MSSDTRVAGVTVRSEDPVILPEVAMIDVEPVVTPVASPVESIVAVFVALELQETLFVMSVELPSEKTPSAVNG